MKMENEQHPQARSYLNCNDCIKQLPRKTRAIWNCGLMSPTERTGPGFPVPHDWGEDPPICPGYLISMPQVVECARAKLHWDKGQLRDRYEGLELTGLLLDSIEILAVSSSEAEANFLRREK